MFTGLVQAVGTIAACERRGGDLHIVVSGAGPGLAGDSIAVNGVCLTATSIEGDRFEADLSAETLAVTTLAALRPGDRVNLERALRAGEALGGHLVTGHVDAVSEVLASVADARSLRLEIALPPHIAGLVASKGSVCVDGISLTVNAVGPRSFSVAIVPYTQDATIAADYRQGTRVNLEVDLVARYLQRLLTADPALAVRHGAATGSRGER